jgi:hypothetical protein
LLIAGLTKVDPAPVMAALPVGLVPPLELDDVLPPEPQPEQPKTPLTANDTSIAGAIWNFIKCRERRPKATGELLRKC